MGVRKFRSVADMPGPAPLPPLDPDNLRRFRSVEDADAHRQAWEAAETARVRTIPGGWASPPTRGWGLKPGGER
jgi:hypothetical protein